MVDKKAQQEIRGILTPSKEEKRAFLDQLGPDYQEPRGEQEWLAYSWLRQWWSAQKIEEFVGARAADEKMAYPGIIDTPQGPLYNDFIDKVDLLAVGAHARTLPRAKMLEMVAGRAAAHGAKFESPAKRRDPIKRAIMAALTDLPESKRKQNIEVWNHVVARHRGGFIEHIDEFDRSIEWISPGGKVKTTVWKNFQNRCARYRKKT
jgi:hypothetical protein